MAKGFPQRLVGRRQYELVSSRMSYRCDYPRTHPYIGDMQLAVSCRCGHPEDPPTILIARRHSAGTLPRILQRCMNVNKRCEKVLE